MLRVGRAGVRKKLIVTGCLLAAAGATASTAQADFPWPPSRTPSDYTTFRASPGQVPSDLHAGDSTEWKYAATPEPGNTANNASPFELGGVRGGHVVDRDPAASTAWRTTTGRPDVRIAVLDSGIKWNDHDAMVDLRRKTWLNVGELPKPNARRRVAVEAGLNCRAYDPRRYDANGDGVVNVVDWACDTRVTPSAGQGPPKMLIPEDLIVAFSDGTDRDRNGYVDDIVGWDFLDNDNNPYDDVQYGHGTGEARDSTSEVNEGQGDVGSCPNCMVVITRVGDSFVADANAFAQATLYAVDNGALVVQEALGTLNNTRLARDAVQYAYDHGVAVIASAADEAAQHHNYVSALPHTIVVNSVNRYNDPFTPLPRSYLQFNGCTNFSSKITLAIPSTSCSSNATGIAAGLAGLVYSAALNARQHGRLPLHPTCRRADGTRCVLSANEVRELMASGTIGGVGQADDVNFAGPNEPSCSPPVAGCTDPNLALQAQVSANRPVVSPLATTRSYPARKGHDQFYGYGRVNTDRAVKAVAAGTVPPEVEITSPQWFAQVDPRQASFAVQGTVSARGAPFTCRVLVAPGSYPNNTADFAEVGGGPCDGSPRTGSLNGTLGTVSIARLRALFPSDAGSFDGREPGYGAGQTSNGRPNSEPYGFVVRVVAQAAGAPRTGEDQRNLYLHRDRDMLAGFPRTMPSDGASSPLFADLDGDNRNELVYATSDGIVHAQRRDGSELRGWPVAGDPLPSRRGARAFGRGGVRPARGAFLASVAVGDLDHDGVPEVVGADYEGKVYVWSASGRRLFTRSTEPRFSGRPLSPFVNVRDGKRNRTQRGFIGSPVLADLDGDGRLEIVAAAMDRHVYAWHANGRPVAGFPVLVVDRTKVSSVNPLTHAVKFKPEAGPPLMQGAIVNTPAVWDVNRDGRPEIVVGTNEEYLASADGGLEAGGFDSASVGVLGQTGQLKFANGRLFAIRAGGEPGGPRLTNSSAFLSGWPVKVGRINAELLPIVGEGITGSPVVGPAGMDCGANGGRGPKVGVIPDAGLGYVLNADGSSCQGRTSGHNNALATDGGAGTDHPAFPAVGHPAFGNFAGGISFLSPAAGLLRALDLAVNEYQSGGQDFLSAWDPVGGRFRSGFPARVNDLQFLTGPSVANIDGGPGEQMLGGTAYLDLAAFNGDGSPASDRWPKLTSDWTVANPLIGSFGTLDTAPDARKAVVAMTRSGTIFAYGTTAPACSPGSWPRFHHDNANSGAYDRDAVAPGAPMGATRTGAVLAFQAPGDDGLCGRVTGYQVVTSDQPIAPANFARARKAAPAAAVAVAAPGARQEIALPVTGLGRFVAVRAVDDQGNLGRPAVTGTRGPRKAPDRRVRRR
jgi:hypothetical protein